MLRPILIITSAIALEYREFVKICQGYITNATAEKVDGYSFVASYKEADIAAPQEKKNKLLELVNEIIHRKQQKLELLKASLLKMHKLGLIDDKLTGKTRTISIQPSPSKIAQLQIEPNAPEIPEEFSDVRVEYRLIQKRWYQLGYRKRC